MSNKTLSFLLAALTLVPIAPAAELCPTTDFVPLPPAAPVLEAALRQWEGLALNSLRDELEDKNDIMALRAIAEGNFLSRIYESQVWQNLVAELAPLCARVSAAGGPASGELSAADLALIKCLRAHGLTLTEGRDAYSIDIDMPWLYGQVKWDPATAPLAEIQQQEARTSESREQSPYGLLRSAQLWEQLLLRDTLDAAGTAYARERFAHFILAMCFNSNAGVSGGTEQVQQTDARRERLAEIAEHADDSWVAPPLRHFLSLTEAAEGSFVEKRLLIKEMEAYLTTYLNTRCNIAQDFIETLSKYPCPDAVTKRNRERLGALLNLIKEGADINFSASQDKGNTALHYACGIVDVQLRAFTVDLPQEGLFSLQNAIVEWLILHGADMRRTNDAGETPLQLCSAYPPLRHPRALLLAAGAGADGAQRLDADLSKLIAGVSKQVMEDAKDEDAESAGIRRKLLEGLVEIKTPRDISTKGALLFLYACRLGDVKLAEWLAGYGCPMDATDERGRTGLCYLEEDSAINIRRLLNAGHVAPLSAELRARIDAVIARLQASDHIEVLYRKRLLTLLPLVRDGAGVNLSLPETKGNNALHYACAAGDIELVRLLLELRAAAWMRTDKGMSPKDCIGKDPGGRIRQLIVEAGG